MQDKLKLTLSINEYDLDIADTNIYYAQRVDTRKSTDYERCKKVAKKIAMRVNSHQALINAFNPRTWTLEMHDAWHKNLPDTQKAFEALKEAALLLAGGESEKR